MLRYPNGQPICVGDHVWWNEGACIGYIERIMETDDEIDSWGLSQASIALSNIHPLEIIAQKRPQEIGAVTLGGTVVYSLADLYEEGVGLLSASEEDEFSWAVSAAAACLPEADRGSPYCVTALYDASTALEHWHIQFLDRSGSVLHHATFPFRPGTRSVA
jgi:hypothetical protein